MLDRSWVAGVLPFEVMLSHIFTQFLVLIGQTTITLIFIFLVFEIPCNGPVGWIVVIAVLQGFAGMCFGKNNSKGNVGYLFSPTRNLSLHSSPNIREGRTEFNLPSIFVIFGPN